MPSRDFTLLLVTSLLCAVPPLLNVAGFEFGSGPHRYLNIDIWMIASESEREAAPYLLIEGPLVHTLWEWTAASIAVVTAFVSFVHYFLKRDITTPVIGTALLFAGIFDGFRVLAVDRLLVPVAHPETFVPFTWSLSRLFHVAILIVGTLPFVLSRDPATVHRRPARDVRDYFLVTVLFAFAAFTIIFYCATSLAPPAKLVAEQGQAVAGESFARPWDAVALALYLIGGGSVLMRYQRKHPSLFARSLQASIVPHVCAQLYATFGTEMPYDNGFHIASAYKAFGYFVPLVGLMVDYRRASRAETDLRTTERQLQIAHDISASLMPAEAPNVLDHSVAGYNEPSEAVGGDYYDYISLPDGATLLVIADVSGHDLGAALLTADARAYLKALSETESSLEMLASKLNTLVGKNAKQKRFITGMLVRVPGEGDDRPLRYLAAGHTGYVVRNDGGYEELKQANTPFGVLDELPTPPTDMVLESGETLILVTDGIVEALNPKGEPWGLDRLCQAVRDGKTAEESLEAVKTQLEEFCAGRPAFDDKTLVLLRRS